ncbi:putative gamma-glutamyltransferase [Teladorsagia circumcincta]|uniref:Putative gamma-glutamyltransferase n=1 Tax=Teladorsagia circumcincta TaxID=45464 RepID=A0A2G9UX18_TELCI|nr:putative gamma-glutamyltransferase [Teladorsagia circumcincta]
MSHMEWGFEIDLTQQDLLIRYGFKSVIDAFYRSIWPVITSRRPPPLQAYIGLSVLPHMKKALVTSEPSSNAYLGQFASCFALGFVTANTKTRVFVTTISTQPFPDRPRDVSGTSVEVGSSKTASLERNTQEEETGFRQFITTLSAAVLVMLVLITLVFFFTAPAYSASIAGEVPFEWGPPSNSVEGKFRKAAVTTDHATCSEIGGKILKKGGNAVDASIAVMFCLGVTNPQSSGLGGGFLMTIYNKTEGKCVAIDARETAPAAAHRDMFRNDSDGSKYGFKSAGTPGELAGYWYAFTHHGSGRVAWKELIEPSVKLCRRGVPVSEYLDNVMKVKERHFRLFPSMKAWINPATNSTYRAGDLLPRLKLAQTLEKLANSNDPVKLFYRGEMADTIAKEMADGGGIITKADLASYKPRVYKQLANTHFRGNLVMCGGPPPSSFAVTQLIVSVMSALYPENHGADILSDPKVTHHFIEAMKFAYAQRTLLGDVAFVKSAETLAKNLTTEEYTKWVVQRIRDTAQPSVYYGGIAQSQVPDHGTSQVSALDELGNGVSSTTTINRWFGAAVESEAYGIVWNDEMDDFSTPGMANG